MVEEVLLSVQCEVGENVDIAMRAEIITKDGAEHAQFAYSPLPAKIAYGL